MPVKTYRVIAQGEDAVATGLPFDEAVAVYEFSKEQGKRHVAIVDEGTDAIVDIPRGRSEEGDRQLQSASADRSIR